MGIQHRRLTLWASQSGGGAQEFYRSVRWFTLQDVNEGHSKKQTMVGPWDSNPRPLGLSCGLEIREQNVRLFDARVPAVALWEYGAIFQSVSFPVTSGEDDVLWP